MDRSLQVRDLNLSNRAKRRDFAAFDEDIYLVGRLPKVLKEA